MPTIDIYDEERGELIHVDTARTLATCVPLDTDYQGSTRFNETAVLDKIMLDQLEERLTPRQWQIFRLMRGGMNQAQAAQALGLNSHNISTTYIRPIRHKWAALNGRLT